LKSGGCRSSSRFQYEGVPFRDFEVTAYLHIGPEAQHSKGTARLIIGGGGPGQRNQNCCIYSIGFDQKTGRTYAEEEGSHEPLKISPMAIEGDTVGSIGPVVNRNVGIKFVLWHDGGTQVEGYVDSDAIGQWRRFYKATKSLIVMQSLIAIGIFLPEGILGGVTFHV
jgi:hypothetical protein